MKKIAIRNDIGRLHIVFAQPIDSLKRKEEDKLVYIVDDSDEMVIKDFLTNNNKIEGNITTLDYVSHYSPCFYCRKHLEA